MAYDETKKEVAKWDSVVNANRKVRRDSYSMGIFFVSDSLFVRSD